MITVRDFDETTLKALLVAASHNLSEEGGNPFVADKRQVEFLLRYLSRLETTRIVVEPRYVDKDFLEDFAAYHVRSFHAYERLCTRLHFFAGEVDEPRLHAAMLDPVAAKALNLDYRGFVVVRPLPDTIIGRTCLRTFNQKPGVKRVYPTLYTQHVNLFGIELDVETVAFQEQDRDVAACATSALWSVLQKTGRLFQHAIPSPVQITGTAAATGGYDERMLPAIAGLTIRQIADALRFVGLEPHLLPLEVHAEETALHFEGGGGTAAAAAAAAQADAERRRRQAEDEIARSRMKLLLATAAYLSAGIPCMLLVRVTETFDGELDRIANHAVALTGYRIGGGEAQDYGATGLRFRASRIDRLFVHDDHVGPFAAMDLKPKGMLEIVWPNGGSTTPLRARSHTLVVPLNHKIRIPFSAILELAIAIAGLADSARKTVKDYERLGGRPFEWDIALSPLKDLRAAIAAGPLSEGRRVELLTTPMPRYAWRIAAVEGERSLVEILLDATDLVQGEMLIDVLVNDEAAGQMLGSLFATANEEFDISPAHRRIRLALSDLVNRQEPPEKTAAAD
ncbi:MAG: hypothetical protein PGN23_06880 [Sphingomonas adhaesiva]|uniref:hypothetical protein n=1 Tax=Sphingomonas adhaesiva TaxID=28212 RepID=UPI002FF98F59